MITRKILSVTLQMVGMGFALGFTTHLFYPKLNPMYIFLPLVLIGILLDIMDIK